MIATAGVTHCQATDSGMTAGVHERNVVPTILSSLHEEQVPVFGAHLRPASMEDVYFALEQTFAADPAS